MSVPGSSDTPGKGENLAIHWRRERDALIAALRDLLDTLERGDEYRAFSRMETARHLLRQTMSTDMSYRDRRLAQRLEDPEFRTEYERAEVWGTHPATSILNRYVTRLRWEVAYDEAVQRRDWQTCDYLLETKPSPLPWLLEKFVYLASGAWARHQHD